MSQRSVFRSIVVSAVVLTVLGGSLPARAGARTAERPPVVTVGDAGVPPEVLAAARDLAARTRANAGPVRLTGGGARALDLPPINCLSQAQFPHASTQGMPGSVDGKAVTSCSAPVNQLQAQASLYEFVSGYGFLFSGRGALQYQMGSAGPVTSVAFAVCVGSPRYYVTTGYHFIVAPPYYSPPTVTVNTQTPVVTVSC
ncbi:hypothetical protein Asp14428_00700 [Actinoplanes sp. NBRC 14428]|uniref:Secreted protein n=1 Tax=Pseudosporangium ferrugineum TaxID=439699 RepID=A0A2T0SJ14_9ACTN|nr:hypothetical protein [Pseudosporangium ferrugineum]PRY33406.1 hypothetical protein CLV70_101568 [Pseudosporangium ferrugineum]BCJ48595.1 hypothetical protein Asp14428_00700 [Actinoplanes sp. NBRC 14428]